MPTGVHDLFKDYIAGYLYRIPVFPLTAMPRAMPRIARLSARNHPSLQAISFNPFQFPFFDLHLRGKKHDDYDML